MAAAAAGSSARYLVPDVTTDSIPVRAGVGELAISEPAVPLSVVGPVFVTPAPASTAKLDAVPRETVGKAVEALAVITMVMLASAAITGDPIVKKRFFLAVEIAIFCLPC